MQPSQHIAPSDAHKVIMALKDARRAGRDFVDVLHEQDLLLTSSRRKQILDEEFALMMRTLDQLQAGQVCLWFYGNANPRTASEAFVAVQAWVAAYAEAR